MSNLLFSDRSILECIFSFADKATLANSARVSQAWCPVASDRLWYRLDDPSPLFSLMERPGARRVREDKPVYDMLIPDPSWELWSFYASRVFILVFPPNWKWDHFRLLQIFISRPPNITDLLPNLTQLSWLCSQVSVGWCQVFLTSSLTSLTIHFHDNIVPEDDESRPGHRNYPSVLLTNAFLRCRNLQHFECRHIRTGYNDQDLEQKSDEIHLAVETALSRVFTDGVDSLKQVTVSDGLLTPSFLQSLGFVRSLESIQITSLATPDLHAREPQAGEPQGEIQHMQPSHSIKPILQGGGFAMLKRLSVCPDLREFVPLLAANAIPPGIRDLRLGTKSSETRQNVQMLMIALGRAYPGLEVLVISTLKSQKSQSPLSQLPLHVLQSLHPSVLAALGGVAEEVFMTASDIQPLTQCRGLKELLFLCPWHFDMGTEELVQLSRSWPHLRQLHLSPDSIPPTVPRSLPDINLFHALLQTLPHLQTLGLLMSPAAKANIHSKAQFRVLSLLRIGLYSPQWNEDVEDFALSAVGFTPPSCEVKFHAIGGKAGEAVQKVNGMIPFFQRIHPQLRREA